MIKINESRNEGTVEKIISNLEERGYGFEPVWAVVYSLPLDITGKWKNFKLYNYSIDHNSRGVVIDRVVLHVTFYLDDDNFYSRLEIQGYTTLNTSHNFQDFIHTEWGNWDKYYNSFYNLVKPLGFEKSLYDSFQLPKHSYRKKDVIFSIDDKLKKLVPRFKIVLGPPKRKGRI